MDSGGIGFNGPTSMTFLDPKLYVVNFNGNSVSVCDWVSATNTLSGCANTDVGGSASGVVAYSLPGGTATYLFVSVGPSIKRCTITPGERALGLHRHGRHRVCSSRHDGD